MASTGNDVIEWSTDDATIDGKQRSAAVKSRDKDRVSPAVNATGALKDRGVLDDNKSLQRRSTQRGYSVLETNSTSSTTTDTEQHQIRSFYHS